MKPTSSFLNLPQSGIRRMYDLAKNKKDTVLLFQLYFFYQTFFQVFYMKYIKITMQEKKQLKTTFLSPKGYFNII